MIDVDESGAARRVEALPWVARAQVSRRWPATVRISVTERRAVAVTRVDGGGWALLDATARVLEIVPNAPGGVTVIEGLGPASPPGTELSTAHGALSVVSASSPALAARTAAVVAVQGGIEVRLNPRGTVRLGPADNLEAKLIAVETVLAQVDVRNLATLDVRLPSSPVLTRG
jgi:cell division protein FtsQ